MNEERLVLIQKKLAGKVTLTDAFEKNKIAGVDTAYKKKDAVCAAVVLDYRSMEVIEEKVKRSKVRFPYIPTFLAFRESGPILKTIKDLEFDILMVDGHGIAHPRGIGVASHIGVLKNIPTIGVAKRILCGKVIGHLNVAPLVYEKRKVGYAIKTKKKPIYVSPGNMISLESSLEVVLHCIKGHRLPEPIRLAHNLAKSKV